MRLALQPPGGIGDQHIGAARARRLRGIEHHGAPGRRPACCATSAAPVRVAHTCSCSMAAARNVSPAASITLWPASRQALGELADGGGLARAVHAHDQDDIGVVTGIDHQGLRAGCQDLASPSGAARAISASTSASSWRATRLRRSSRMYWVASTPTSAVSSRVSSSSRISASILRPRNRVARPSVSQELPRLSLLAQALEESAGFLAWPLVASEKHVAIV